jgi:flagellar protein FliO/FliZ
MDQVLLAIRVIVSLAVVIGLMWAISRLTRGRTTTKGVPLEIVSRAAVGKKASVVVVRIGERGLVVGVTEHSMALLAEIEIENEPVTAEQRTPLDLSTALLVEEAGYGSADLVDQVARLDQPDGSVVALPVALPVGVEAPRHGTGRRAAPETSTPLTGSVLSPQTWRDMAQVLREKSVRT